MTGTDKIEIALSKSKLIKNLLGSLVFVIAGIWILIYQPETSNGLFNNPVLKYGAATGAVMLGGLGVIYFLKKLIDKRPGLVIDDNGVIDNASAVAAGFIPWNDIHHIEIAKVMRHEFLMFIVKNPNDYLARQTNMLKRKSMEMNFKHYGSPITISSHGLKCDLAELKAILENKLVAYRNKPN